MITFFAVPKPFRGHTEIIQLNAIQSWLRICSPENIILMGDDEGTREVASEFGVRHIPEVTRNEFGTPLVNAMFKEAEQASAYSTLCYINADIILMSDFLPAVRDVMPLLPRFLMVGRRWDLDITERLSFDDGWEMRMRRRVKEFGRGHAHTGIDYFVFPRGLWKDIPPFAIGRWAWDNWLIYRANFDRSSIVDASDRVVAVHQNHNYHHIGPPQEWGWNGVEAKRNLALAGEYVHLHTILDARYRLTAGGIRRRISPFVLYRCLVTLSASSAFFSRVLKLVRAVRNKFVRKELQQF